MKRRRLAYRCGGSRLVSCGLIASLLGLASCSEPAGPERPELQPPVLRVVGFITAGGAAEESAVVDIVATAGASAPCTGAVLDQQTVITGAAGRYTAELEAEVDDAVEEIPACVHVRVRPDGASGWSLHDFPGALFDQPSENPVFEASVSLGS